MRGRRKAQHSEGDEARAIACGVRAVGAWRGAIPFIWGARYLGDIVGDPDRGRTLWIPRRCATRPYSGEDDALKAATTGKVWSWTWTKFLSASFVIDNWYDLWPVDGNPQHGDYSGVALTARVFTNSTTGAMFHGGNVSPSIKTLVRGSAFMTSSSTNRAVLVQDRVVTYDACTMSASSQNMTNTLPATRYISAGDPGLQIGCFADTIHNATAANLIALKYTDNGGNAAIDIQYTPTLNKVVSIAAPSALLGSRAVIQSPTLTTKNGLPYLDNAGRGGARKIESFQWSAAPTGTCSFSLSFPLFLTVDLQSSNAAMDAEFLAGIEATAKRIYDDACLNVLVNPHIAAVSMLYGESEALWS